MMNHDMAKHDRMPLAELADTINRLQGELEDRRREESKQAVAEILAKMAEFDLEVGDLGFSAAELRRAAGDHSGRSPGAPAKSDDGRRIVKPKYRDPVSGTTWAGRGRVPRWMAAAISKGKTREDFLIAKESV